MYFAIIGLITVISGTSGGHANYSLQAIFLVTVDFTGWWVLVLVGGVLFVVVVVNTTIFFMFAVVGTFVARKVELLEVVDVLKRVGRRRKLLMCRSPEVLVRLGRQSWVGV